MRMLLWAVAVVLAVGCEPTGGAPAVAPVDQGVATYCQEFEHVSHGRRCVVLWCKKPGIEGGGPTVLFCDPMANGGQP